MVLSPLYQGSDAVVSSYFPIGNDLKAGTGSSGLVRRKAVDVQRDIT